MNDAPSKGSAASSGFAARVGRKWVRGIILVSAWVVCFVLLSTNITPLAVKLEVGKPAMRTVVAHRTVVNIAATEALRQEARKNFLLSSANSQAFMSINESVYVVAESRLDTLFSLLARERGTGARSTAAKVDSLSKSLVQAGIPSVPQQLLYRLMEMPAESLGEELSAVKNYVTSVLKNKKVLESNLAAERKLAEAGLKQLGLSDEAAKHASELAGIFIEVNTSVDIAALEKGAADAEANVQPVFIQKGTVIAKMGEIVTEEQINLTKSLGLMKGMEPLWARISLGLLTALILATLAFSLFWIGTDGWRNVKKFGLALILVTVSLFMSWAAYRYLGKYGPLFVPLAYIAMSLTLMVDTRTAITASVAALIFNGFMFEGSLMSLLGPMAGIVLGILTARGLADRFSMVRAAFYIALSTMVSGAAISALTGEEPNGGLVLASVANGLTSAVLCLGSMPFAEVALGLASPFRLLEVSNPGNELLRKIMMEAPGTYHHSIVVGNLAEAAAARVKADPLLVRSAALYHDCGKVRQPGLFVENQVNKVNPHDELPPEVSAGIIIEHVTYGMELAREHRLPASIIDIIAQHHGNSKVWYFYHKALAKYGKVENEDKFNYPGPRPQTAEAALIMLADITEAKVRAMNTMDKEKVGEAIHSLIRERLYAGDLNETPLTLKDLKAIEDSFVSTISGVKHDRIAYPGQAPLFNSQEDEEPDELPREDEGQE